MRTHTPVLVLLLLCATICVDVVLFVWATTGQEPGEWRGAYLVLAPHAFVLGQLSVV